MIDKCGGLIGLAKKAGKIAEGYEQTKEAIYAKKTRLILIAQNASSHINSEFEQLKESYPFYILYTPYKKEQLGAFLGRAFCSICAVTDIHFSSAIADELTKNSENEEQKSIVQRLMLAKNRKNERTQNKNHHIRKFSNKGKGEHFNDK